MSIGDNPKRLCSQRQQPQIVRGNQGRWLSHGQARALELHPSVSTAAVKPDIDLKSSHGRRYTAYYPIPRSPANHSPPGIEKLRLDVVNNRKLGVPHECRVDLCPRSVLDRHELVLDLPHQKDRHALALDRRSKLEDVPAEYVKLLRFQRAKNKLGELHDLGKALRNSE